MPIFSLDDDEGIGTLGECAYRFIDFLADAGMTYWQILPAGPTGFSNSPYQPLSSFAGNPYLINMEMLVRDGYLEETDLKPLKDGKQDRVDYGFLYKVKIPLLKKAAFRMDLCPPEDYLAFVRDNAFWLKDYALFMAIKEEQKGKPWQQWPEELRRHDSDEVQACIADLSEDISAYEHIQYFFFRQYGLMKKYAEEHGIQLIGDLPFYLAEDSIDVWSAPEQFAMNDRMELEYVAGMPGQKWGNPLYNWDRMRSDDYRWWTARTAFQYRFCDVLRLDHFHGFLRYYAVKKEGDDEGSWHSGPGLSLLEAFQRQYGWHAMIAEDLGELTPELIRMVKDSGLPGMKILQYAFDPHDPGSVYMPFQYDSRNAAVYTGTHDNNTLVGWVKQEKPRAERAAAYLGCTMKDLDLAMMRCAFGTTCDLAMVQTQDLLRLDEKSRTNVPGRDAGNWSWRMKKGALNKKLSSALAEEMKLYCRYNWTADQKKAEREAEKSA